MADATFQAVDPNAGYKSVVKGQFISCDEFTHDPTFLIDSVQRTKLERDKGGRVFAADAVVVFFSKSTLQDFNASRGWVLNRTNAECLAAMFGQTFGEWVGKRVTLKRELVRFGAETVPAIRVKGSPDIADTVTATIKSPRKKAVEIRLVKTGKGAAPPGAAPSAPQSDLPPVSDPPSNAGDMRTFREPGEEG